jgi:hypothetical protein
MLADCELSYSSDDESLDEEFVKVDNSTTPRSPFALRPDNPVSKILNDFSAASISRTNTPVFESLRQLPSCHSVVSKIKLDLQTPNTLLVFRDESCSDDFNHVKFSKACKRNRGQNEIELQEHTSHIETDHFVLNECKPFSHAMNETIEKCNRGTDRLTFNEKETEICTKLQRLEIVSINNQAAAKQQNNKVMKSKADITENKRSQSYVPRQVKTRNNA